MCIIVVQPEKKKLSRKIIETCFANNPDGAGYMFVRNNRLVVDKGFFTLDSFYQAYKLDNLVYGETSPFILHFRIATHGTRTVDNCHPHRLSNTLAFAHNGIFTCVNGIRAKKSKSDTVRAGIIFKQLPSDWFYKKGLRVLVEEFFMQSSSYGAFLDNKGAIWMTSKNDWNKNKGIYYSNNTYSDNLYWPTRYDRVENYGRYVEPKKTDRKGCLIDNESDVIPFDDTWNGYTGACEKDKYGS